MPKRHIFTLEQLPSLWKLRDGSIAEVAVVVPTGVAPPMAWHAVPALAAWRQQHAIGVTLIGGDAELRAHAVMHGLRTSTSVAEWERWLINAEATTYRQERRQRLQEGTGWRVMHFIAPHESQPAFVAALGRRAGLPSHADLALTPAERHEETLLGRISGSAPEDRASNF